MRVSVAWLGAGVIAAAAIGASSAGAQTPPPSSDNVTVVGKRPVKPCNEHDAGCILAVAKEVWTRYPRQIERFCTAQIVDKEHQLMLVDQLGLANWGPANAQGDYELPPALKKVCDYKLEPGQAFDRSVPTWAPWAAVPSAADLAAAYPRAGRSLPGGGDAKINCSIDAKGKLGKCMISQEFPDHKGFGEAALHLAGKFMVQVDPARARPTADNWVDVAVHFTNPSTPAAAPQVMHPDWVVLPDVDRTARLFPPAASQAGVRTGVARVDCQVGEDGALNACKLVSEEPAGMGFGEAALAAAPAMHANLWSRDGLRTPGAHVVAPLRFNADDAQKSGS